MKKLLFMLSAGAVALSAAAQAPAVKDAERALKSDISKYPTVIEEVKVALEDPAVAADAANWFVAGKYGMEYFDQLNAFKQMGKETDDKALGHAIIDGYGYLVESIKNDSVPDAKGKIKTKYSKDAVKLINNHYNDFNIAGIYLFQAGDYNGAYDAWTVYAEAPNNPVLGKNAPAAPADTIIADIYYNRALAAWQGERLEDALASFDEAIAKGYDRKNVYDYAIAVAYNLHDTAKMADYAAKAYPLFGNEDSRYIGYIINDKIANKKYDEAREMLEGYIAQDPNNAQLYYVLGILYDSQEDTKNAMESYKKAVELDGTNAQALLQYGNQMLKEANRISDEASNMPANQYNEIRATQVDPLLKEASGYLEKAYEIDPDNMDDALRLLRNIYYNLNDETNYERINSLML